MGRAIPGAVVAFALALAGCGGDDGTEAPAPPKVPPNLAAALAAESDQIAENLAAGDECAADLQAQALRVHVGDAVASGAVPPAVGREMSAAAGSLDDGIACAPPSAPEPKPKPAASPDQCEQLEAQLVQLQTQVEQAKEQEKAAHGQDKKPAKDLKQQHEEQAKQVEEQLKAQCGGNGGEGEGDGGDESGPPGQQGDNPENGNGRGGGGDD